MLTSTPTIEELEDRVLEVSVYGLKRRESVVRLLDALAVIPYCLPLIIFRIDRYGRLLGVVDQLKDGRVYYVQVSHWGRQPDQLPVIGWTRTPRKISRGLQRRADKMLLNYTSGVRQRPMVIKYSGKDYAELSARMAPPAS